MANDRLLIVCTKCDYARMLFKFYPGSGYIGDEEPPERFIIHHLDECHGVYYSPDLCDNPGFKLLTENGLDPGVMYRSTVKRS